MANPTGRGGFQRGKSGNPGGRPRALASVMHEARRHTFEALRVLLKLMRTAESEVGAVERCRSNTQPWMGPTNPGASSRWAVSDEEAYRPDR